ncbi:MAG: pyruvate formate lyase family protein, partial [Candidatus Hydrogenedentes bacterium]|nr:pyruvate formate lyase family protein [Candidatus Hydrogenedentota bacterium]
MSVVIERSLKPSQSAPTGLDSVFSMKPTARVERLRETFLNLEATASIYRARIETRVMKETEGESVMTRRAKIFAATVREMPINIYPEQMITGGIGVWPRCINVTPLNKNPVRRGNLQTAVFGLKEGELTAQLSDEDTKELLDLTPYWAEQGRMGKGSHFGHNIHGHEKVVKKGFLGIKKDAEDRLARLDLSEPEDAAKVPFLEGVAMAMEAAAEIGDRYAAKARELAGQEEDAVRKAELLKIAEVCDWVPANPARTFHEALQAQYLSYMLLHWEVVPSMGFSQGRIDQHLYPYYESDIREGRTTREEAQELLDCFFLGLSFECEDSPITVGGVKANGSDATNDLSYMIIEASMHTRLSRPWLSVLVHNKMPDALLIKACELTSLGAGHPQFVSNDVMVEQALARGDMGGPSISLEDARSASPQGCFELVIPGKDSGYLYFQVPNLAACVEYVMTNGVRRSDGEKLGIETGDPRQFESFEEVQEAFCEQLAWMRRNIQIAGTKNERTIMEFTPTVYESALIDDCIEEGVCREFGGAHYNFNNGGAVLASTDAADSLAAIKKLVFEEEKITMAELCDALDNNFVGHEKTAQMLLKVPKFGNDNDEADEHAAWVLHQWMLEFNQIKNLRGGRGCPGGSVMGSYVPSGKSVGALPSGRLAGTPLVDASSPSSGKDLNGPTAVVKSMGKIDHGEILGGVTFNLRMDPAVFKNGDMGRLSNLIRTFVDQKIFHMQINVVSSDTLRAAQKAPEEYNDLVVKV